MAYAGGSYAGSYHPIGSAPVIVPPTPGTAFPSTPLPVFVEVLVDGTWRSLTDTSTGMRRVRMQDAITIVRGLAGETQTQATASVCSLRVHNPDGLLSPRNPTSPWYGKIGRNTQLRVYTQDAGGSPDFRFWGEISQWPQEWGHSRNGADVSVPINAAGLLQRLGQGAKPLKSTFYRAWTQSAPNVIAYWPCEDSAGAESLASGLDDGIAMEMTGESDDTNLGSYEGFPCSESLPTLGTASQWTGKIKPYTATGTVAVRWLMHVPTGGFPTSPQTIVSLNTAGNDLAQWRMIWSTTGNLELRCYDTAGTLITTLGPIAFAVNNKTLWCELLIQTTGANSTWSMATLAPGAKFAASFSGSIAGRTFGRATSITVSPGGGMPDTSIGHVSVQSSWASLFLLAMQLNAYRGERAAARFQRLCTEESIPFEVPATSDTNVMGFQLPRTMVDLLQECADADSGQLYESRTDLALGLIPLASLASQTPTASVPYARVDTLTPTEDDQAVRNDVTRSRPRGSSRRRRRTTGPLNTQPAPAGVGTYDDSTEVNVGWDRQLKNECGWALNLGTVDEPRYPSIGVELAHSAWTDAQRLALRALDQGDRLTISGPPLWLPPDDISQIILGYTEILGYRSQHLTFVGAPESPYNVGRYGQARYSQLTSTLAAGVTSTATSLSVATSSGPVWTNKPASFPFDIVVSGERITVTNITGTSSPQLFTVTRSINGVVKALASGESVQLYRPGRYKKRGSN